MTNGEFIRNMSDSDLARVVGCPEEYKSCDMFWECKYGWHEREETCEECTVKWLNEQIKE
jgi:hypothetical protein